MCSSSQNAMIGAMSKLNPFRSGNKVIMPLNVFGVGGGGSHNQDYDSGGGDVCRVFFVHFNE